MTKTHYDILHVSKDSSHDEIKAAHRKLALQCHPDKIEISTTNASTNLNFHQIQQAWECLRDPQKRHTYDTFINRTMKNKNI